MIIEKLKKTLLKCYSKDLCYIKVQDQWNESNKTLGMCAITSLVVNDYFGGEIAKTKVDGISHYFNLIHNQFLKQQRVN